MSHVSPICLDEYKTEAGHTHGMPFGKEKLSGVYYRDSRERAPAFGAPPMEPIPGGMLFSGKKAAELSVELLKSQDMCAEPREAPVVIALEPS